ncbi:hypothetical protein ACFU5O_15425 [Streptomyces sp. NPDC057445]|uniref:hypothetical protein n=1 Tax=Streptomyces sp. NPDC057445 TaxID=3346136 RepID=UPI0036C50727
MSVSALAILGVAAVVIVALALARPVKWPARRPRRIGRPTMRTLDAYEREQYVALWAGVQEQFVDSPATAVARASELLDRLADERGVPSGSPERRLRALSTLFPARADSARQLYKARAAAATGDASAESLRQALVAGRALFEELVTADPHHRASSVTAPRRSTWGRRTRVRPTAHRTQT